MIDLCLSLVESMLVLTEAMRNYSEAVNGNRGPAATALKKAIVEAHAAGALTDDDVERFMSIEGLAES